MKEAALMIPWAQSYIGVPYSQMDCQAFIEACLRDIGINVNLSGSNAWYRRMDWVGTPEECKRKFGSIPPGAFLFIVTEVSDSTPEKYRHDGLGDAEHIGLYTNIGLGAIHSSSSKGCVCESKFRGKTIPHGGWNRVGLWTSRLEYSIKENQESSDDAMGVAVVTASSGYSVRLRAKPNRSCSVYWYVPVGSTVTTSGTDGDWTQCEYNGRTGWMLSEFLAPADGADSAASDPDPEHVTLTIKRSAAEYLLAVIETALKGGKIDV